MELCLIMAGMDTEGEIFDDCLVYVIGSEEEDTGAAAAANAQG